MLQRTAAKGNKYQARAELRRREESVAQCNIHTTEKSYIGFMKPRES